MKETIYTIPLMDAVNAHDECPLCYIEKKLEEHAISFILGSAYMEDDIRMDTDKTGFCRSHYKKMFDYGNRLGTALILSTHMKKMNQELKEQLSSFQPEKTSLFKRMKKTDTNAMPHETSIGKWTKNKSCSCYVCNHIENNYSRYLDTFFEMWKTNPDFVKMVQESKGFCLPHFGDIIELSEKKLNQQQKQGFYQAVFPLMESNMKRLEEEVLWFTDKYDYRNRDKDWGNSKDSIQRCMQKLCGGYPADPPFQADL